MGDFQLFRVIQFMFRVTLHTTGDTGLAEPHSPWGTSNCSGSYSSCSGSPSIPRVTPVLLNHTVHGGHSAVPSDAFHGRMRCKPRRDNIQHLKPVLNWAIACSPKKLRTVRRILVRPQLACNEMRASARTCGRRAADSMIENVG